MKYTIFALAILLGTSCAQQEQQTSQQSSEHQTAHKEIDKMEFLKKIPEKSLPVVDSTSFDNHQMSDTLSEAQVKLMKLRKLPRSENAVFSLNYGLTLSPYFKTYIVSYYPNEQEMCTALINYTDNFEIIASKIIAYDEIAESMTRKTATISLDKIEITEKNMAEEEVAITKTSFYITKNGEIK